MIMTENMKAFIEQSEQNAALKADLDAAKNFFVQNDKSMQTKLDYEQKIIEIAANHGFALTSDDFITEIPEDQLENISGGNGSGVCVCVYGGWGGGLGPTGAGWCVCPYAGAGKDGENSEMEPWCFCFIGGGGA